MKDGRAGPTEAVEIRTLDNVVADPTGGLSGEDVLLLKVDAEGEDEAVLVGADALLRRCHPVVIVETWEGGDAIRLLLAKHGYRVYRYEPARRQLVEFPADWSGQANLIAVAACRAHQVTSRLAEAADQQLGPPNVRWLRLSG